MFINEYGDKNNPMVLLLAPMMAADSFSGTQGIPTFRINRLKDASPALPQS